MSPGSPARDGPAPGAPPPHRARRGQGVGFRPFVYTLAEEHGLTGWVTNDADGVRTEVEGPAADVDAFTDAIGTRAPPLAVVESVEHRAVPVTHDGGGFTIRPSASGPGRTLIPGHGNLRRLPGGARRPGRPAVPAPVHHLYALRAPVHRGHRPALRPAADHHGRLPAVRRLRPGVRRSGRPPLPRPADRLSALRPRLSLCRGPGDPGTLRDAEALVEARRLLAEGPSSP